MDSIKSISIVLMDQNFNANDVNLMVKLCLFPVAAAWGGGTTMEGKAPVRKEDKSLVRAKTCHARQHRWGR